MSIEHSLMLSVHYLDQTETDDGRWKTILNKQDYRYFCCAMTDTARRDHQGALGYFARKSCRQAAPSYMETGCDPQNQNQSAEQRWLL